MKIGDLNAIRKEYTDQGDCLTNMLHKWLQTAPNPNWDSIITALSSRAVGEIRLAEDIKNGSVSDATSTEGQLQNPTQGTYVMWSGLQCHYSMLGQAKDNTVTYHCALSIPASLMHSHMTMSELDWPLTIIVIKYSYWLCFVGFEFTFCSVCFSSCPSLPCCLQLPLHVSVFRDLRPLLRYTHTTGNRREVGGKI